MSAASNVVPFAQVIDLEADRSALTIALELARKGYRVHPLRPHEKKPILDDWPTKATADEFTVLDMFVTGQNVGIACGDELTVLDADGPEGIATVEALGLPRDTPHTETPGGGRHYYLRNPPDMEFGNRTKVQPGLDVRGAGGQVVAPGCSAWSRHEGQVPRFGTYVGALPPLDQLPIMPANVVALMVAPQERSANAGIPVEGVILDDQTAIDLAKRYLADEAPRGVMPGGRGMAAFKVAARLGDIGISLDMALDLIGPWNDEHGGAQDDDALAQAVENSYRYRRSQLGIAHPLRHFFVVQKWTPPPVAHVNLSPLESFAYRLGVAAAAGFTSQAKPHDGVPQLLRAGPATVTDTRAQLPAATGPGLSIGSHLSGSAGHGFKWTYENRERQALPWIVYELMLAGSWGLISADTGFAKTFLLTHLAMCLGSGRPFFGREILAPGGTVIVAAEAEYATPHRTDAARLHGFAHMERPPIAYCGEPPNLLTPAGLEAFIAQLHQLAAEMQERHGVPLRMVVFDTLAKSFLINEDKASEAVLAHNAMERIAVALNVAVIAAAHVGKDETRGTRGSASHEQNAHFVLTVPKKGTLHLKKQKEAEAGIILGHFSLPVVELGTDPRGKVITSRAIDEQSASQPFEEIETPEAASKGVSTLHMALMAASDGTVENPEQPGAPAADREAVRQKFNALYPQGDRKISGDGIRKAMTRALKQATNIRKIEIDGREILFLGASVGGT